MKTVVPRYSVSRDLRSSAMDCKIASSSSRALFGTCAGQAAVARGRARRAVRRACAAHLPARPTSRASATSTLYHSGSDFVSSSLSLEFREVSLRMEALEWWRTAKINKVKRKIS